MWKGFKTVVGAALVVASPALVGCGNDSVEPEGLGTILVTVETTGSDLDPNGYTVSINGLDRRSLMLEDATVYDSLVYGNYVVLLEDVAANCRLVQNPWNLIASKSINLAEFIVTCLPTS